MGDARNEWAVINPTTTTPPDLGVILLRVWAWSAAAAAVLVLGTAVWMGVGL